MTEPSPALVTRTLRHEVGDLLQSVYATVALLRKRLPPEAEQERQLLADLRGRAEHCRDQLDAAYELVSASQPEVQACDLADLAAAALAVTFYQFPSLRTEQRIDGPLPVEADAHRLQTVLVQLVRNACQSARQRVAVAAGPAAGGAVEWSVTHDGAAPTPNLLAWLERPFPDISEARFGMSLSLARRLMDQCGGTVTVDSPAGEGGRVRLTLPRRPDGPAR